MLNGSCLCGATRFEIDGDLAPGAMCHCGQCRKQTSHVYASTHILKTNVRMIKEAELRWYAASDIARRGFCGACGSVLFWDPRGEDKISVSMGAIAPPHDGRLTKHIFAADKGDHYDIGDGLPQHSGD